MGDLIDFRLRKRVEELNEIIGGTPQAELSGPTREQVAHSIAKLKNEEKEAEISRIRAALEILEDSIHDVTHRGARSFLICENLAGKWVWKWANLDNDVDGLIAALSPIYNGAMDARKAKKNNE